MQTLRGAWRGSERQNAMQYSAPLMSESAPLIRSPRHFKLTSARMVSSQHSGQRGPTQRRAGLISPRSARFAQRAESMRSGCPAVHDDEFHLRPPGEAARTGAGRILDAVLSTIAVTKAGTVIAPAVGTTSCNSCKRFASITLEKVTTPVRLPPGRFRLSTRPNFTGSLPFTNTMGIVVVTAFAASADAAPPSTWR